MRSIHHLNPRSLQHVPAIKRVAPALARGRKVIGRHAGNPNRLQVFVEFENLRVHPNVRRIHVDENRHVAQDPNCTACGSLLEKIPLPRKRKLQHLLDRALAPVFGCGRGQRLRIAASQRLGPLRPRAGRVGAAQVPRRARNRRATQPGRGKTLQNPPTARPVRARPERDRENFPRPRRAAEIFALPLPQNSPLPRRRSIRRYGRPRSSPSREATSRLISAGLPANAEEPA